MSTAQHSLSQVPLTCLQWLFILVAMVTDSPSNNTGAVCGVFMQHTQSAVQCWSCCCIYHILRRDIHLGKKNTVPLEHLNSHSIWLDKKWWVYTRILGVFVHTISLILFLYKLYCANIYIFNFSKGGATPWKSLMWLQTYVSLSLCKWNLHAKISFSEMYYYKKWPMMVML